MAYTTINKSSDYFNTKLYTGNNTSTSYTGVGFQPDWIWIKDRSQAADHTLIDAVRGVKKVIISNSTNAEGTDSSTQGLNSFDSDGFTLGTNSNVGSTNNTGDNYVAWNWKANGSGSANSDGSDSSTVSANTTAGFSIVKWTPSGGNATVGHGLGAVPEMMISFRIDGAQDRFVYHKDIGNTKYVRLNQTTAPTTDANAWNNTTPTSSVFSVGSQFGGSDSVQYCFTSVKGFSKIGSYTGNQNADGSFIYTGFKPAWLLIKNISDGDDGWLLIDNKRSAYNQTYNYLTAHANSAEGGTGFPIDLVSNGFKIRGADISYNQSGYTYIYMAFAEAPLVGSNNVPATAR